MQIFYFNKACLSKVEAEICLAAYSAFLKSGYVFAIVRLSLPTVYAVFCILMIRL